MSYRPPNREESEEGVRILAKRYPKCFFTTPEQRRPLKKKIIDDLLKDGVPIAREILPAIVERYQTHLGYHLCLQAGRKRIDLNGKEVGTVTPTEQIAAEKEVLAIRAKMKRDRELNAALPPVKLGATEFSQFVQKINPPQPAMSSKPMITPTPVMHPKVTRIYDSILAASAAMFAVQNPAMLTPIIVAMMRVIIEEAQAVIDNASQTAA